MTMTLNELKKELDNLGVRYDIGSSKIWLRFNGWNILSFAQEGFIGRDASDDTILTIPSCNPETAILKDVLPLVVEYLETPLSNRVSKVYIKVMAVRFGDDDDVFSLEQPKYVHIQTDGDAVLVNRKDCKFDKSDARYLMKTKFVNAVYELILAGDED